MRLKRGVLPNSFGYWAGLLAVALALALAAACSTGGDDAAACVEGDRTLNAAFFAYFEPVSYSVDGDTASDGFNTHLGYEADLLTALEAMQGAGLKFSRKAVADWDGIWLLSAGPDFDLAGGGITILESRTFDASGNKAVVFTSGHITFRQSLLVRAEDAARFSAHAELTDSVRVGALVNTTGEHRLLEITGIVDDKGTLAAGTRVRTAEGEIVADGSRDYFITAAGESPNLKTRLHLFPPSEDMPQVVYLSDDTEESEMLNALRDGTIDAVARGEVGNRDAAHEHPDEFEVTAFDEAIERGGFTLSVDDAELVACLNEKIDYLTDDGRIDYAEWREDPSVFLRRAEAWSE